MKLFEYAAKIEKAALTVRIPASRGHLSYSFDLKYIIDHR
jgi:hypothetical protein